MSFKMADVVYNLLDCGLEIRLKVECKTTDPTGNLNQSERRKDSVLASEGSELELKLDIEELQELNTMCTRSSVRMFISQFINRMETLCEKIPSYSISKETEKIKWSDIVAGRHPSVPGTNLATAQSIETVITSRSTDYYHYNKVHEAKTSRTNYLQSTRQDISKHRDGRPRVVILGDSHARGIASELLQQSNHQISATGYVKPNAGLTELLRTAKSDLHKLSSRDAVIVIGGSNDIGKGKLKTNLTSIVKFLDDLQHTNVIFTEIPARYDIGASPWIHEQIKQYNKKLGKVTKSNKQVKLIRTTNREHYTKHGVHLNSRGKDSMAKEMLTNLQDNLATHITSVIHLPWKNDIVKVGNRITHDESLNGTLNKDIGTHDCNASSSIEGKSSPTTRTRMEADSKAMSESNGQQESKQGLCKVPGKGSKIQRNCPKKK